MPVAMARSQPHPQMRERLAALTGEAQTLHAQYLRARVDAGELRPHAHEVAARMVLLMWRLTDASADELTVAIGLLLTGIAQDSERP